MTSKRRHAIGIWALASVVVTSLSCSRDEASRPASTRSTPASVCAGPARVNSPANVAFFPPTTGAFCLDPVGSDKAYGEGSPSGIDGICDLVDGECETYKRFGVRRLVEVRYVAASGSDTTIDVYLSKFSSTDNAYAMFTHRVVGDADPARPPAPQAIAGGGAAALGLGNAYLWRGAFVAELTYNDPTAGPDTLKTKSSAALPPLVAALGKKLTGTTEPPAAVGLLPTEHRLALGVQYLARGLLGIDGAGAGAYGYYRDEKRRWRVLSIARTSPDGAKDAFKTIASLPGAQEQRNLGDDAVRFVHRLGEVEPQTEWVVARWRSWVLGIGDEPRVLGGEVSSEERAQRTLPTDEKRRRLEALLKQVDSARAAAPVGQ